jgi:ABC-2 type transport system ATP-binding protein
MTTPTVQRQPVPAPPPAPNADHGLPTTSPTSTPPSISLQHASRWYKQVIGLNDVSCHIGPGLTALLGPNGAGKSTLLKLITGQLRPTTGTVHVAGMAPFANGRVMRLLGYCPEIDNFYEEMTGREFVTLLGAMAGLKGATLKARVDESIARVGMEDRCDRKLGGYSKGMRQRIKVAQAIVHDPQVIVLDEPLNGLDPVGRREMSQLMMEFARQGRCVLVSSHILYEVEQITDNILLIERGRIVAQGNLRGIRDLMDRHPHHITLTLLAEPARVRALARDLLTLPSVLGVRFDPQRADRLTVETAQPDIFYSALPDVILAGDYPVADFYSPDNSLEAVFNYLVKG